MSKSKFSKIHTATKDIVLIIFAIFLTEAFLRASAFDFEWSDRAHNIMRAVLLAVIAVRYISGWIAYGIRDIWKILILCAIALALASSRFFNDVGSFIDAGLLLLAVRDIEFRKILKIFMIITAVLLIVSMIAALSANIENYTSYHGMSVRYAFGTLSAIDFAAYFFYLELAWFAIRREKIRYIEFAVIAAIIVILVVLCSARTSAAAMILALAAAFILKLRSRTGRQEDLLPRWLLYAGAALVTVCAVFIILATYRYSESSSISLLLDRVLNNRLSLGKYGMDEYGFSLFGRMVETIGVPGTADYFFIDSSFVFILLRYGIVTFLGAMALFQIPAFYAAGKRDAWMVMILAIISLHCIMEHHLLAVNYNPFMFALAAAGGALAKRAEISERAAQSDKYSDESRMQNNSLIRSQSGRSNRFSVGTIAAGAALLAVFVISTVYFLITCGTNPAYGVYNTTVPGVVTAGELPADSSVEQEVLLPKDICGIDIMFNTDEDGPADEYVWKMWESEFGHSMTMSIKGTSIRDEEYTRIITDSGELLSWLKYRFSLYPADGSADGTQIMLSQPTNDFCRKAYENGSAVSAGVMNFNLIYRYNDWRMEVWIFELTVLCTVCCIFCWKSAGGSDRISFR